MKLKCEKHNRRVLSVPTSTQLLHRTGDMSKCDSTRAVMVDNVSHTTRHFAIVRGELIPTGTNKKPRPHAKHNH